MRKVSWGVFGAVSPRSPLILLASVVAACGGGPQIKVMPDYRAHAAAGKKVFVVPLAVSDDLGDARTGIILSSETRATASLLACHEIASERQKGRVVCVERSPAVKRPELAELEVVFASDKPIPSNILQAVSAASGADYVLLFRPESVSSSHDLSDQKTLKTDPGVNLLAGPLVGMMTAKEERTTSSRTEITYTVSAALVELRTGKLLKVGVHSGSGSRNEEHYMGFAEAPPAVPILATIMSDLGDALLDD